MKKFLLIAIMMFLVGNVEAQSVPRDATVRFMLRNSNNIDLFQNISSGSYDMMPGYTDPAITHDEDADIKAYTNGLRFTDYIGDDSTGEGTSFSLINDDKQHEITLSPEEEDPLTQGQATFSVKSMVPSGEVLSKVVDTFTGKRAYILSKDSPRNTVFLIEVPNVDEYGELDGTITPLSSTYPLEFEPFVRMYMSDKAPLTDPELTFVEPSPVIQFLIGVAQEIHEFVTTDRTTENLPAAGVMVSLQAFVDRDGSGEDFILHEFEGGGETVFITGEEANVSATDTVISYLKVPAGILNDVHMAFFSKINFDLTDDAVFPSTKRTITHPGGNLGNQVGDQTIFEEDEVDITDAYGGDNTELAGIIVGADIEGQILTNKGYTYQEGSDPTKSSRILEMGGSTAKDVREEITKNAYKLIRNKAAETNYDFDVENPDDFVDGEVTYYQGGTVVIDEGIIAEGRHTIVIEDGNLFIVGDLSYESVDASLGVILINSDVRTVDDDEEGSIRPISRTGNIFVSNSVRHFVGTYFADGGIMSTNFAANATPSLDDIDLENIDEITDMDDADNGLNREDRDIFGDQLILEGTLLTRNTLGGAMLEDFINPWGPETNRQVAQRYDLHFIRRYAPPVPPDTSPDRCYPDSDNCDPNHHAFVIRPDGRVQNMPPPGFK